MEGKPTRCTYTLDSDFGIYLASKSKYLIGGTKSVGPWDWDLWLDPGTKGKQPQAKSFSSTIKLGNQMLYYIIYEKKIQKLVIIYLVSINLLRRPTIDFIKNPEINNPKNLNRFYQKFGNSENS